MDAPNLSTEQLAQRHFHLHHEIGRAMTGHSLAKALELMDKRDSVAAILSQAGWNSIELGANAVGISPEHFQELVCEGVYSPDIGQAPNIQCEHKSEEHATSTR